MRAIIAAFLLTAPAIAAPPAQGVLLQNFSDEAAIRHLVLSYGQTLDARDFDGFARLWAKDAVYLAGDGKAATGGPAIAASLRRAFAGNALGVAEPNYHVFFNQQVEVQGDRAVGTAQSFFVTPAQDGSPHIMLMATYRDRYQRVDGRWLFLSREVRSAFPRTIPRE